MIKLKTTPETKRQSQELKNAIKTQDTKRKIEIINKLIVECAILDNQGK